MTVGTPGVRMPGVGAVAPTKNTEPEAEIGVVPVAPVIVNETELLPGCTTCVIVHVVEAPGANVVAPQVIPLAAMLVTGKSPVLVTVTEMVAVLPGVKLGPGAVQAAVPLTVAQPTVRLPGASG